MYCHAITKIVMDLCHQIIHLLAEEEYFTYALPDSSRLMDWRIDELVKDPPFLHTHIHSVYQSVVFLGRVQPQVWDWVRSSELLSLQNSSVRAQVPWGPRCDLTILRVSESNCCYIGRQGCRERDNFRTIVLFPANFVTLLAVIWLDGEALFPAGMYTPTTLNCNITPNISSIKNFPPSLFDISVTVWRRENGSCTTVCSVRSRVRPSSTSLLYNLL